MYDYNQKALYGTSIIRKSYRFEMALYSCTSVYLDDVFMIERVSKVGLGHEINFFICSWMEVEGFDRHSTASP